MAAALAAVLATYTRYVGFSLYVLITLAGLFVLSQRPAGGRRVALSAVAGLLVYALCVAPLAIRNLVLTGHVGGLPRPPSLRGVWETFWGSAVGFLGGFFPVSRSMVAGPSDFLQTFAVSLAVWSAAACLVVILVRRVRRSGNGLAQPHVEDRVWGTRTAMVLGVFAVLYVTMIITLATLWTVNTNTRMFYPALLCIVLLLACRGLNLIPQFRYPTTAW